MRNRSILILLAALMLCLYHPQASAQQPAITIKNQTSTVGEIIKMVEQQTSMLFFYNDNDIDLTRKVRINATALPLHQLLDQVFRNSHNSYKIDGRQIFVTKKNSTPTTRKRKITGIVSDTEGPMIGVTIRIKGSNNGVISGLDGDFELDQIDANTVLELSYVGYRPLSILIGEKEFLKINMEAEASQIKEILITAQALGQKNAIQRQINSPTIKNVVSAEKLQQNPDANTVEAIGRLPGVTVNRSGGEGAGFLLRGLDQGYSKVMINGEPLPVGLNVISTYALQGVDVYKSLTANLEGDAVAGTVDLTLRETPKGLHYSALAQGGYNALNRDLGNYNFVVTGSNRFFDDKLGIFLSLNADRINHSTGVMSAGYNTNYSTNLNDPFYLSSINFNLNEKINYKQSAVLNMDYKAGNTTLLSFQTFLSLSNSYSSQQAKSFAPEGSTGTVPITVNLSEIPNYNTFGITSNLRGRTNFSFLGSTLNYGVSFSHNNNHTPGNRTWLYSSSTKADGMNRDDLKVMYPDQVASKFDKILTNLEGTRLDMMTYDQTLGESFSVTPGIDYEVPFKIGSGLIKGKVQIGAKVRWGESVSNRTRGIGNGGSNAVFIDYMKKTFPWSTGMNAVELLVDGQIDNFLSGKYLFGDRYSLERNTLVFDAWQQHGYEKHKQGQSGGLDDDPRTSGFYYDLYNSAMNDINSRSFYGAGYIMPEINIGKWIMFMPGLRYELTNQEMKGYIGNEVTRPYSVYEDIQGAYNLKDTTVNRSDRFFLPMIHLRIKPVDWFYTHFSYTHTVRRPSEGLSPFQYYNTQLISSYAYYAGNPNQLTELWKSYDLQFTFHNEKIGLISITGFSKTVQDKLWSRNYKRIQGDPIPHPIFTDKDIVDMRVYENHPYPITLKGVEAEWQTSFGYLPSPFKFLTLSLNYTYTHGKSPNPYTRLYKYKPEGSRYEITGRQDSVVTEAMTGIPEHMANVTLGVEYKSFKAYASYQLSSNKIQSTHPNDLRLYIINEPYHRVDFNASYGFNLKNSAVLEILLKVANLTNSEEKIRYRGDPRPISIEQYGITGDLGLRYKF